MPLFTDLCATLFEFYIVGIYSRYSKQPHIRTYDLEVQADQVLIYRVLSEKSASAENVLKVTRGLINITNIYILLLTLQIKFK